MMVEAGSNIPAQGRQVVEGEEFREFNHYYTVQYCLTNCINKAAYDTFSQYQAAVEQLEVVLSTDLDSDLQAQILKLDREMYETATAVQKKDPLFYFRLAKEKFRLLYGHMKKKSPRKVVLAIGRPEMCNHCGNKIDWSHVRPKREKVGELQVKE